MPAAAGAAGDSTASTAATTEATTTALSKAELIEQGDAICAEVNAAVGTVGASSAETGSPAAQAADLYSGMVASLKNLGTPHETDGYAEFSSAAEELATAEDEVKLASERGDTAGLESAESNASAALSSFQEAASEYGFEDCSEGPSAPTTSATPESGEAEAVAKKPKRLNPKSSNPKPKLKRRRKWPPKPAAPAARPKAAAPRAPPKAAALPAVRSGGIGPG